MQLKSCCKNNQLCERFVNLLKQNKFIITKNIILKRPKSLAEFKKEVSNHIAYES